MQEPPSFATTKRVGCVMWLAIVALVIAIVGMLLDITQELAWNGRMEELAVAAASLHADSTDNVPPTMTPETSSDSNPPANEQSAQRTSENTSVIQASGPTFAEICDVNESDMTDPQIKAHADSFVGRRFENWPMWVYDVTDYGSGQYDLELAGVERGLFWTRDVVVENINSALATSLNVEQQVLLSGRIDRVDTTFEVVCNPIYISLATITLADGSQISASAPNDAIVVSSNPALQIEQPTPTPLPTWTPVPSPTAIVYLGDTVTQEGYSLAAVAVENPTSRLGMFYEPQPGKKVVAIEVAVGNVSGSETFSSNVLNGILIDPEGFLYPSESSVVEDDLELIEVAPGQVVRGWIGFVVPENVNPHMLRYEYGGTGVAITIGLNHR